MVGFGAADARQQPRQRRETERLSRGNEGDGAGRKAAEPKNRTTRNEERRIFFASALVLAFATTKATTRRGDAGNTAFPLQLELQSSPNGLSP